MRILVLFVVLCATLWPGAPAARAGVEPRTVMLVTDPASAVPALATPSLTQLGLVVELHDTRAPMPPLKARSDVRGIVVWLSDGAIADEHFTEWVKSAAQSDLPVVLMGALPDVEDRFGLFLALDLLYANDDRTYTYDMRVVDWDEALVGYERQPGPLFPTAPLIRPLDAQLAHSVLVLERRSNPSDRTHVLIATPKGGFAADGYAVWQSADGTEHRWLVDPVAWFRTTLRLDPMPVPDPTTINGRRIFAPSMAAARPEDSAAAGIMARTLESTQGLRLPLWDDASATAIPPRPAACADGLRARLLGYGGLVELLGEEASLRRTSAFAPSILVCNGERNLARPAADAVFAAASALPLSIQRGDLKAIQDGFHNARIESLPGLVWRVHDRGALQTVRFDDAALRVDWSASDGVLGAARVFDSLYIALDPDSVTPTVALTQAPWTPPPFPVLVESRWNIFDVQRTGDRAAMTVEGDGEGAMAWSTEPGSNWEVRLSPRSGPVLRYRIRASDDGLIAFSLPPMAGDSGRLDLIRYYGADGS